VRKRKVQVTVAGKEEERDMTKIQLIGLILALPTLALGFVISLFLIVLIGKAKEKLALLFLSMIFAGFFLGILLLSGCRTTECASGHYESVYHPDRLDMTYIGDKGFGPVWQPGYLEDEWVYDEK